MKLNFTVLLKIFLMLALCGARMVSNAQDLDPQKYPHLKGYWKFQDANNLTKATVGSDLVLVGSHSVTSGPVKGDTAVRIGLGSYYKAYHGIAPNGGGNLVNQYTMMYDFKVLSLSRWHTFFQTDTTNMNDGECFIKPASDNVAGTIGTAATKYTPDPIAPGKWYRLMISVNSGNYHRYYLNGKLVLEGDTQDIDDRFALQSLVLFFADNNEEDDTIEIASLAIFDTCLSSQEIAEIGSVDPCERFPVLVDLGDDTAMCSNATMGKGLNRSYASHLWSTGDTTYYNVLGFPKLKSGMNTVWLRATDVNGCTATDTIMVNIVAQPVLNLGVDRNLCQGQAVNLSAGNVASNKYVWYYLPSGDSISAAMSILIDSSGTYAAFVQNTFGCVSRDTITITVNPLPAKPIIAVTGSTSLCSGDSVVLSAPGSYSIYNWNNGSKSGNLTVKNSGAFSVMVIDTNACQSPWSDTVIVNAFITPPKAGVTILGKTTFCSGDSVLAEAKANYPEYIWSTGDTARKIAVRTQGPLTLRYKQNGCVGSASDAVPITVHTSPAKPIIQNTGDLEFCEGDSVKLEVSSGYNAYFWQDFQNKSERIQRTGGKFSVYVRDSNFCVSPVSDTVEVIVNPRPTKPSITGTQGICPGDTAFLQTDKGFFYYEWNTGSNDDAIWTVNEGFYTVFTKSDKGCMSLLSDTHFVARREKPVKPVITIVKDSLETSGGTSYKWFKDGEVLWYTTAKIPALDGIYRVYSWNGSCWSEVSDSLVYSSVSIAQPDYISLMQVYPNPAGEHVVVKYYSSHTNAVKITLFCIDGKTILSNYFASDDLHAGVSLDLSHLEPGLYFISIQDGPGTTTKKIRKQ